jgi:hypothetical protein
MRSTIFTLIFVTLINLLPLEARSEQHLKDTYKDTYIVGVESTNYYPVYSFSGGKFEGILAEILDKFAADNNIKFIYRPYKPNDLFMALFKGEIDIKVPDNDTWKAADKRDYKIIYSNDIICCMDTFFTVPGSNINIDMLKKVGVATDVVPWFIQHYVEMQKIKIVHEDHCGKLIDKVLDDDLDAILCNYDSVRYFLNKSNKPEALELAKNLPYLDDYINISTIYHPQIIKHFNIWLGENSELIKQLQRKYLE